MGLLKKQARCSRVPDFAAALGQEREPGEVDHQRRRQQRIATLPGELQRHLRAEKPLEVNVVPGRLPVVERLDVLDGDERLRPVAEEFAEQRVLALHLAGLVLGVAEHHAVAVAEDVVADPAEDFQIAPGEQRREHGLEQRLAGLQVLARERHAALPASSSSAGIVAPRDGVRFTYGNPGIDRGECVEAARRQRRRSRARSGAEAAVPAIGVLRRVRTAAPSRPRSPRRVDPASRKRRTPSGRVGSARWRPSASR